MEFQLTVWAELSGRLDALLGGNDHVIPSDMKLVDAGGGHVPHGHVSGGGYPLGRWIGSSGRSGR
jgi:hypothetical protein